MKIQNAGKNVIGPEDWASNKPENPWPLLAELIRRQMEQGDHLEAKADALILALKAGAVGRWQG